MFWWFSLRCHFCKKNCLNINASRGITWLSRRHSSSQWQYNNTEAIVFTSRSSRTHAQVIFYKIINHIKKDTYDNLETQSKEEQRLFFASNTTMENVVVHSKLFCWNCTIYQGQCLPSIKVWYKPFLLIPGLWVNFK